LLAIFSFGCVLAVGRAKPQSEWRLVNAGEVEIAWRIRTLQFFSDDACTQPLEAIDGQTGEAFATAEAEMTGASHAFELKSHRGWESVEECKPGACHLGFRWSSPVAVRCLLVHQGDLGFHASAIHLEARSGDTDAWKRVVSWKPVEGGRSKLAMSCPERPPAVHEGHFGECKKDSARSQWCALTCSAGFGAVEQRAKCMNGVWYTPECLPVRSMLRVVAEEPALIKPYWVVLHATLYAAEDCTDVIRMDGTGISSGEYVIKYANYHPKNVWDGDSGTSWASSEPCTPGACWFGFRFRAAPPAIRCVKLEHPEGSQYHADRVLVQQLGEQGWEELAGVNVRLLPDKKQEL